MREHIETLIVALTGTMHREAQSPTAARAPRMPRRRRPRVARSTYVPVQRDTAAHRFAH
ncbi:hypothetical protein [Microbacterium atlanticum]|jgi:hypothetical protein|uniref:hypothetical protein n=1 Tax=Microbacterium atlanticum TaxID=2782168 RepID=UPI00188975F4|nr:hypothetical protein [Microbacterium atlanticum]